MSWLSRLTWFSFASACAFLCASVFLIWQYKLGIPYPFATSVALTAAIAVVAPLLAVVVYTRFAPSPPAPRRWIVFCVTAIILAALISIAAL